MYVGPYRLLTRIGEGGMGVVHLGQHPDGRRVAIKVLRPHVVSDDEARRRLDREVNSLSRVHSPRVAEVIDADPWGPIPYVATRYVPGLSLHQYVAEEGPLAGADLEHFARGLAQALQAVHDAGVLHRDVKPSNVLMEGRNPVLIDFGLARLDDDAKVTRTGYLLGTPGYLAPETLFGEEPTTASDVHSWAATVAFAGTGRAPFGTGNALVVMDRVRSGQHVLDGLDGVVRPLVTAALDLDPARRPTLPQVLHLLSVAPTVVRPLRPAAESPVTMAPVTVPPVTMPMVAAVEHRPTEAVEAPTRVEPAAPATLVDAADPTRGEPTPPGVGAPAAYAEPPTAPGPQPWPPRQHQGEPTPTPAPRSADRRPVPPLAQPARAPYQEPPAPAPRRTPWPERVRRWCLGATAVGALAGATAVAPFVAALVVVLAVALLRAGSVVGSARAARRAARGPRWWDPIATVVTAPWHVAVSSLTTVVLLAWAAILVACVLLVGLAAGLPDHAALAGSGLVLAAAVWTGPGSGRVRSPLLRVAHPIARAPLPWAVWCAVLVLLAAAGLLLAASEVQWWPGAGAPWGEGSGLDRFR